MQDRPAPTGAHPILWILAGAFTLIEALSWAAEAGLQDAITRVDFYRAGAFWDLYFDAALSGGPLIAQVIWSLLTYAFLHGSWFHLVMNTVAMLAFGNGVVRVAGPRAFLTIFVASAISGALSFGLIAAANGPMVGASGAVFGILGALLSWQARALVRAGHGIGPVIRPIIALACVDFVLAFALDGLLAWEAHLGGFVAGFLVARLWDTRHLGRPAPRA